MRHMWHSQSRKIFSSHRRLACCTPAAPGACCLGTAWPPQCASAPTAHSPCRHMRVREGGGRSTSRTHVLGHVSQQVLGYSGLPAFSSLKYCSTSPICATQVACWIGLICCLCINRYTTLLRDVQATMFMYRHHLHPGEVPTLLKSSPQLLGGLTANRSPAPTDSHSPFPKLFWRVETSRNLLPLGPLVCPGVDAHKVDVCAGAFIQPVAALIPGVACRREGVARHQVRHACPNNQQQQ